MTTGQTEGRKVWVVGSHCNACPPSSIFMVFEGSQQDVLARAATWLKADPSSTVDVYPGEVVALKGDEPIHPVLPPEAGEMDGIWVQGVEPRSPYFQKYTGENGWDGGDWDLGRSPEELAAQHEKCNNRGTMVIKMTGPGFDLNDWRRSPDFLRIQAELVAAQKRMDDLYKELAEKFPCPKGLYWSLNKANTLGRYSTGSTEDD